MSVRRTRPLKPGGSKKEASHVLLHTRSDAAPKTTVSLHPHPPARIRRASPADRGAVLALLEEAALPTAGLDDAVLFVAAEPSGRLAGTCGLEVWGRVGLLRSLAVAPSRRGTGLGRDLVEAVLDLASDLGLREVDLLTSSAGPFFARLGWVEARRDEAPAALRLSAEMDEAVCAGCASFLRKALDRAGDARADGAPGTDVHGMVRARYARTAAAGEPCCDRSAARGYRPEALASVPAEARLGLGCGAPLDAALVRPARPSSTWGRGRVSTRSSRRRRSGPRGRSSAST